MVTQDGDSRDPVENPLTIELVEQMGCCDAPVSVGFSQDLIKTGTGFDGIADATGLCHASGGEIPAVTASKLVFKHLRAQPSADIRSGKWNRYLDALEKVGQYSSSEPRDIYSFYLQRGMPEQELRVQFCEAGTDAGVFGHPREHREAGPVPARELEERLRRAVRAEGEDTIAVAVRRDDVERACTD